MFVYVSFTPQRCSQRFFFNFRHAFQVHTVPSLCPIQYLTRFHFLTRAPPTRDPPDRTPRGQFRGVESCFFPLFALSASVNLFSMLFVFSSFQHFGGAPPRPLRDFPLGDSPAGVGLSCLSNFYISRPSSFNFPNFGDTVPPPSFVKF